MAGRVWMKGGANAAWITEAVNSHRSRPRSTGPKARDATSGAPGVRVPVKRHAAPQGAKFELAPFGAPRPHVGEGREMTAHPAPTKQQGR